MLLSANVAYPSTSTSKNLLYETNAEYTVFANLATRKTEAELFDSLESKGQSNWITKTLYKALIRSQLEKSSSADLTLIFNPEAVFADYENRIIGNIYFINKRNSESTTPDTSMSALQKTYTKMNYTHMNTRAWRLKQSIHFKENQPLNPSILSNDERLLRSLEYISDVRIYVEPTFSTDTVDVVVITKDAMPLSVGLDMNNLGEYQAELTHRNILGLGAEASAQVYYEPPFSQPWGYGASLKYENIGRSYTNFYWKMLQINNKHLRYYQLEKPFQSTAIRFGGAAEYRNLQEYVSDTDSLNDTLARLKSEYYNVWVGWSKQVGHSHNQQIIISGRAFREHFSARPDISADKFYSYHHKNMVLGAVQLQNFKYFNTALIRNYGIIEDIPHGQSVKLTGGYEIAEFFSRPYFAAEYMYAKYHFGKGYYSLKLYAGSFIGAGQLFQQGNIAVEAQYFTRLYRMGNYYIRQFIGLSSNYGIHRFDEESIIAKETLPGISSQYLRPFQSKTALRFEPYLFTPWHPMKFRFILSAHADIAAVREQTSAWNSPVILTGIGIGVTVRNEFLVIQNLAIRITYFPTSELYGEHFGGGANTANPARYKPFNITQPEVIPLR